MLPKLKQGLVECDQNDENSQMFPGKKRKGRVRMHGMDDEKS